MGVTAQGIRRGLRERLVEKYGHGSSTSILASPGVKLKDFILRSLKGIGLFVR